MLVKVLIKRNLKKDKLTEIYALLNAFRSGAMNQPGYISGETLVKHNDPQQLLVISTWMNIESWENWKTSKKRLDFENMLKIYQQGETQYEEYVLGSSHREQ